MTSLLTGWQHEGKLGDPLSCPHPRLAEPQPRPSDLWEVAGSVGGCCASQRVRAFGNLEFVPEHRESVGYGMRLPAPEESPPLI